MGAHAPGGNGGCLKGYFICSTSGSQAANRENIELYDGNVFIVIKINTLPTILNKFGCMF